MFHWQISLHVTWIGVEMGIGEAGGQFKDKRVGEPNFHQSHQKPKIYSLYWKTLPIYWRRNERCEHISESMSEHMGFDPGRGDSLVNVTGMLIGNFE